MSTAWSWFVIGWAAGWLGGAVSLLALVAIDARRRTRRRRRRAGLLVPRVDFGERPAGRQPW